MADLKTKQIVAVTLKFSVDVPDGLKGMAAVDKKLDDGIEKLADELGIKAEDIERADRPQRVKK